MVNHFGEPFSRRDVLLYGFQFRGESDGKAVVGGIFDEDRFHVRLWEVNPSGGRVHFHIGLFSGGIVSFDLFFNGESYIPPSPVSLQLGAWCPIPCLVMICCT